MSLRTKKSESTSLAAIGFNDDTNTGLDSKAADHVGLMSGGSMVAQHGTDASSLVYRLPQVARVALAQVDTAGGVFAWANPTGGTIIIQSVAMDVTTVSSGACAIDVGVAANATTSSDTIIDGASVATTARVVDDQKDAGTNGTGAQRCTSSQFVTASVSGGGASAGLVGFAYITYYPI